MVRYVINSVHLLGVIVKLAFSYSLYSTGNLQQASVVFSTITVWSLQQTVSGKYL